MTELFLFPIYSLYIHFNPSKPNSPPLPHLTTCTRDFSGNTWKQYPFQNIPLFNWSWHLFVEPLMSNFSVKHRGALSWIQRCWKETADFSRLGNLRQTLYGPPGLISPGLTVYKPLYIFCTTVVADTAQQCFYCSLAVVRCITYGLCGCWYAGCLW